MGFNGIFPIKHPFGGTRILGNLHISEHVFDRLAPVPRVSSPIKPIRCLVTQRILVFIYDMIYSIMLYIYIHINCMHISCNMYIYIYTHILVITLYRLDIHNIVSSGPLCPLSPVPRQRKLQDFRPLSWSFRDLQLWNIPCWSQFDVKLIPHPPCFRCGLGFLFFFGLKRPLCQDDGPSISSGGTKIRLRFQEARGSGMAHHVLHRFDVTQWRTFFSPRAPRKQILEFIRNQKSRTTWKKSLRCH